ncbi:lasso RiPP family leader peptide-containing protein [Aestuariibacter sp. GS-14]|uniref:lasso RiPP family leader peptide-containing protein n=1 Tax=Alteromonadaceae TaxID=72275 RepID=UPI00112D5E12|nr:lasso RiPP family leader peptide-containing protein [Aestuariibacter sp. GS-14]TPV53834.1 lasso RiPP family leader peptide-containing protein [Aestuariibacter sp. GS-14]
MTSIEQRNAHAQKREYSKPALQKAGSLAELTQGFSGSVPDEQGGHTKRNPFQG